MVFDALAVTALKSLEAAARGRIRAEIMKPNEQITGPVLAGMAEDDFKRRFRVHLLHQGRGPRAYHNVNHGIMRMRRLQSWLVANR